MSIAIVVLAHNRLELLRQCVDNVLGGERRSETREIVVWDNASSDGTPAFLDSLADPRIRVVHHPRNIGQNGYAEAFASTKSEFMIDLDDDVIDAPRGLGSDFARRVQSAPRGWLPCSRSRRESRPIAPAMTGTTVIATAHTRSTGSTCSRARPAVVRCRVA